MIKFLNVTKVYDSNTLTFNTVNLTIEKSDFALKTFNCALLTLK